VIYKILQSTRSEQIEEQLTEHYKQGWVVEGVTSAQLYLGMVMITVVLRNSNTVELTAR